MQEPLHISLTINLSQNVLLYHIVNCEFCLYMKVFMYRTIETTKSHKKMGA